MLQIIHDTFDNYQIETVPILFYPNGLTYRARYKVKNVEQTILTACRDNPYFYKGHPAIVCLRYLKDVDLLPEQLTVELEKVVEWRSEDRLVPIRYATIESIRVEGLLVHILYRIGQYFAIPQSELNEIIKYSLELNAFIRQKTGWQIAKHSLFSVVADKFYKDHEDTKLKESERWQRIVGLFALVGGLTAVPYPRIERICEVRDGQFDSVNALSVPAGRSNIQFNAGSTYCLTVADAYPQELLRPKPFKTESAQPEREYEIILDDCFVVASSKRTALGGYEQFDFVLQVRDAAEGRSGEIQLKRNGSLDNTSRVAREFSLRYEVVSNVKRSLGWSIMFGMTLIIERIIASPAVMKTLFPEWALDSLPISVGMNIIDGVLILGTAYFLVEYLISKRRHQEALR